MSGSLGSVIYRQSLQAALSMSVFGKPTRATFCVWVVPNLQMPEFCVCERAGRGISAALNALWDSGVELTPEFSKEYYLRAHPADEVKDVFNESVQQWFLKSTPLHMPVRHLGDVVDTCYQLELHVSNNTLTLCCHADSHSGLFANNFGPLTAPQLQGLVERLKQAKNVLVPGE
jgi:hypothetical protein